MVSQYTGAQIVGLQATFLLEILASDHQSTRWEQSQQGASTSESHLKVDGDREAFW